MLKQFVLHENNFNLELFSLLVLLQFQLVVTPPVVSTGTFILVLRMLAQMCARSPNIAVKLLEHNIVGTLLSLLLGSASATADSISDDVSESIIRFVSKFSNN